MTIETIKVPALAESVADASLLDWHVPEGATVQEGDKLVDIETDKVVLEVVAPRPGQLIRILKPKGASVSSEEVIAEFDSNQTLAPTPEEEVIPSPIPKELPKDSGQTVAIPKTSPAVRKIAAEQGIALHTVPHQGERITKADLLQPSRSPASKLSSLSSSAQQTSPPFTFSEETPSSIPKTDNQFQQSRRPEERVPMTRLRKRAAERLLNAQQQHAILTTFNEINMKAVMDLRQQYKDRFEKHHGVKLGLMSFFVKAAVAALQKFPIINASTAGEDIIYHGYYDIGIAVSSPRGLVVPILRNVDNLSLAEIEKGIANFAKRAQDAQLTLEELSGGTFTITNGGVFGSMLSTPILNPPQSAILGMHAITERPIAEQGQVVIRPIMYVALSYDHRLIDGKEAVSFLVAIKEAIEDPRRLLLEV